MLVGSLVLRMYPWWINMVLSNHSEQVLVQLEDVSNPTACIVSGYLRRQLCKVQSSYGQVSLTVYLDCLSTQELQIDKL